MVLWKLQSILTELDIYFTHSTIEMSEDKDYIDQYYKGDNDGRI